MGIFDALNTAVGGLQAQSFALQNISGNIANASTTGYKGIDTSFEDLDSRIDDADRQVAGGVTALRASDASPRGHRLRIDRRHQHGDQRRRLLLGAEAHRLVDNAAGLQRRHRLHPRAAIFRSTPTAIWSTAPAII